MIRSDPFRSEPDADEVESLLCAALLRLVFTGKQCVDLTRLLTAIQQSDSQLDGSSEPKWRGGAVKYLVHTFSGICTKRTRQTAVLHLIPPAQLDLASMATTLPRSCQEEVHEYGIKLQSHLVFILVQSDPDGSPPVGSNGRRFSRIEAEDDQSWYANRVCVCAFVVPFEWRSRHWNHSCDYWLVDVIKLTVLQKWYTKD